MKAREAVCSIKVGILICNCDRHWKSSYCCWKRPFFYFPTVFPPQPFATPQQAKKPTRGRFVSSAYLGDKTRVNPNVLWTSCYFHSGLWGDSVFERGPAHAPPPLPFPPASAAEKRAGHRGKGEDRHRFSACVLRVTFLSGVAAHQAEIMRPRFMISNKTV